MLAPPCPILWASRASSEFRHPLHISPTLNSLHQGAGSRKPLRPSGKMINNLLWWGSWAGRGGVVGKPPASHPGRTLPSPVS